jgi:glycosyltransferase involved in cell wall biosynthesis
MKIMLLVSSMHVGGAERVAATLVNAWAARGDVVTLVPTYSFRGDCLYPIADEVQVVWLAEYAGTCTKSLLTMGRRLIMLRRLVDKIQPDVVVSFLTHVNIAAILATWGKPIPVIVCERTHPAVAGTASKPWRMLRRWLYPYADMVTVQCAATAASFARMVPGIKRLMVIPNPVPATLVKIPPIASGALGPDLGRWRVMAMGRLVPEKQFEMLIDAFSALAERYPAWDLWIWGEGPERAALTDRIVLAGLLDRIQLPGRTLSPWDKLASGHAFVLSSAVEGFPNVLLEAMALGLPCVAFDCPSGPRELTRDGRDGLLVPNGDGAALTNALAHLMSDAILRADLGRRAAAAVRHRYALPTVLAQWDNLFEQVGLTGQGTS